MTAAPSLNLFPSSPPPPGGWHGHPLFTLEALYRAYRQCRRRKRRTHNAMRFERQLEAELLDLHQALNAGAYAPGPSTAFLVTRPKRREVFAADFRDRVVHHLLVGHLERFWEPRFIHDSFACRRGKGTLAGVERLQRFLREATANATQAAWYLQLDVRGFFIHIDRQRLYARLDAYWAHFGHAASCRLRARVIARFPWLTSYFRFSDAPPRRAAKVHRLHPRPRWTPTLRRQMTAFACQFPRDRVWLRVGRRWRRLPPMGNQGHGAGMVWVAETGRRHGWIGERALLWRWQATPARLGQQGTGSH